MAPHDCRRLMLAHRDAWMACAADRPAPVPSAATWAAVALPDASRTGIVSPAVPSGVPAAHPAR